MIIPHDHLALHRNRLPLQFVRLRAEPGAHPFLKEGRESVPRSFSLHLRAENHFFVAIL